MASVISQWGLLSFLGHRSVEKGTKTGCSVILIFVCFVIGVLTAVVFALINLFLRIEIATYIYPLSAGDFTCPHAVSVRAFD